MKLAKWRPWTLWRRSVDAYYGLVWSGGYGVQRKVAGAAQELDSIERILGMGFMGMGGLIHPIGGVLFIIVVLRALLQNAVKAQ